MNLKSLPPTARALVEALSEPAADEKYEIVDVEEDGDIVTVTFSRDAGLENESTEGHDDENDDR